MHLKEVYSPALQAYFFGSPTPEELANKAWPKKSKIGSEGALGEVIAAVNKITGDTRLVACKDSPNYIGVAPDRIETTEKTADVVLLTHASVKHDPTLPSVWALPKHSPPGAEDKGKGKEGKAKAKATDDDDDADDKKEMDKVDLNVLKRCLAHVAAVGETKEGVANAKLQLFRRLSALLATPIREYAVGFTLRHNKLKVYVMNACGVFYTENMIVTEENGALSTFFFRLVKHNDFENGLLATTNSLDDRQGPFTLCEGFFPAAAPEFVGGPATMHNVEIVRLIFRRKTECGRATSTYEITVRDGTHVKTHAMSIAWVEESRNTDLAEIRNFIQGKRPRGLAPLVGVFRGSYETLHAFLASNHSYGQLVPRAREVVIHEECYKSLDTVENTKDLARVLEVAIEGHRALWDYGYIHRDVSCGNVMVDQHGDGVLLDYHLAVKKIRLNEKEYRLNRSGTLPYLSWLLLKSRPGGVVHERWHDIESFFYVACHMAFRSLSPKLKALAIEKPEAEVIWNAWNAGVLTVAANDKANLQRRQELKTLVQACASRWDGMEELLSILRQNSSLLPQFFDLDCDEVENGLLGLWESGTMGYELITAGLKIFYESFEA